MQKVLLVMRRKVLAQAIMNSLRDDGRFSFSAEYIYENAPITALAIRPDCAVVEVPESGEHPADETLPVCDGIRESCPGCKVLLLCPENSRESTAAAVRAKRGGRIEDFVFYDSSMDYLVAKLASMG